MSDFLTDEEQVARLKSWWDENGKSLLAGVVVVVVGVIGYRWYEDNRADQIASASALYEQYLAAEAADQQAMLTQLDEAGGGTGYATLAHFGQARDHVEAGDYEAAATALRAAVAAAPEDILADVGRLRLARVLQQLDQTDAALEVLGEIRSSGFRSLVAELRGDIHLARGELQAADEAYAAALESAGELTGRPVLEIKLADTQGRLDLAADDADSQLQADAAEDAAPAEPELAAAEGDASGAEDSGAEDSVAEQAGADEAAADPDA